MTETVTDTAVGAGSADNTELLSSRRYQRGRPLRAVAACDEDILRECPEERFKFSGMGAVIIGTSSLAALSMTEGLATVFAMSFVGALPFGLIWGAFILAIDRWLVATGKGLWHYLPRIVLAIILGVVVAEPFVLKIFGDAIDERIVDSTEAKLETERERYNTCNLIIEDPLNPEVTPDDCEERLLPIERPAEPIIPEVPADLATTYASLIAERDDLNTRLATARNAVTAEELGIAGPGNSGQPGIGPWTEARREVVEGLEADLDRVNGQLAPIEAEVTRIETEANAARAAAGTAATKYNVDREAAIEEALTRREDQLSEDPRFFRRWDALVGLMLDRPPILVARLFLTLFFIAIDTAPAMIKLSTSGGTYDRLLNIRLARAVERAQGDRAIESEHNHARQRKEQARIRAEVEEVERNLASRRHIDLARIESDRDQEIARQEQQLLAAAAAARKNGD